MVQLGHSPTIGREGDEMSGYLMLRSVLLTVLQVTVFTLCKLHFWKKHMSPRPIALPSESRNRLGLTCYPSMKLRPVSSRLLHLSRYVLHEQAWFSNFFDFCFIRKKIRIKWSHLLKSQMQTKKRQSEIRVAVLIIRTFSPILFDRALLVDGSCSVVTQKEQNYNCLVSRNLTPSRSV